MLKKETIELCLGVLKNLTVQLGADGAKGQAMAAFSAIEDLEQALMMEADCSKACA